MAGSFLPSSRGTIEALLRIELLDSKEATVLGCMPSDTILLLCWRYSRTIVVDPSLPAFWKKRRDILPVSWMAAQKATSMFEHNKRDSIEARYDWYVQDELPKGSLGAAPRTCAESYTEDTVVSVAALLGDFFGWNSASHRGNTEGSALRQPSK